MAHMVSGQVLITLNTAQSTNERTRLKKIQISKAPDLHVHPLEWNVLENILNSNEKQTYMEI